MKTRIGLLSFCLLAGCMTQTINTGDEGQSGAAESSLLRAASATDDTGCSSLTNVAVQGIVSASAVWQNDPRYVPEHVIDGSTYDVDSPPGNFWLLPNETSGWLEIDLRKTFKIHSIRLLNTNNGVSNDRGTKDFRIEIRNDKGEVVHTVSGVLPFTSYSGAANPTEPVTLDFTNSMLGRYVKIYSDSWYPTRRDPFWPYPTLPSNKLENQGGGLNEVLVFAQSGCQKPRKSRHGRCRYGDMRCGKRFQEYKSCRNKSSRSVAGCWNVTQYNGHTGMLHLIQTGTILTGNMDWYTFVDSPVDGKISGDSVSFFLAYPEMVPLVGYYDAVLDATGEHLVNGFTFSNNGHTADWEATKTVCPAGN